MRLFKRIADWLQEPELRGLDVESPEFRKAHADILSRKESLRKAFRAKYERCFALEKEWLSGEGLRIELGSSTGFVKEVDPDFITTDLVSGPRIDRIMDAQNMDLPDKSVKTIIAFNVFHHLNDLEKFFNELDRVLVPGGGFIIMDPYYSIGSRIVFNYLFDTEIYDRHQKEWSRPLDGAMRGANQALTYIIFKRDYHKYKENYPHLPVVHQEVLDDHLTYLLCGGLNFRQLLPNWGFDLLRTFEKWIRPTRSVFGLHHFIVIKKVS